MSIVNLPPLPELMVEFASVAAAEVAGSSSKRYPIESEPPLSRHASRRPHGRQLPSTGRRISHAPGFERLTRCDPGDGTNGVTIDAAATGDPERSWIVMDHPFRSFADWSLSDRIFGNQLLEVLLCSVIEDLQLKLSTSKFSNRIRKLN